MMKYAIDDEIVNCFCNLIKNKWRSLDNTPDCIKQRVIETLENEKILNDRE